MVILTNFTFPQLFLIIQIALQNIAVENRGEVVPGANLDSSAYGSSWEQKKR